MKKILSNTIINDKFESVLPNIEESSIDLIIVDPPYNIKYLNLSWDKNNFNFIELEQQCNRILKNTGNILIFQGWSSNDCVKYFNADSGWKFKNCIAWDRVKGRGAKKNLVSTREDLFWFTKFDNYTFNIQESTIPKKTKGFGEKNGRKNRVLSNVWLDIPGVAPMAKEYNSHPTQKPVKLYERIINVFSNEGDIVLDPCSGSCTTAQAAINTNRKYICIEQEKEYYNMGIRRIK